MTPDRIAELRRVADEATPGPWEVIGGGEYVTGAAILIAPDDGGVKEADGAFIAAARTAVPELLAEAEAAEARVGWCRELSRERARQRDEARAALDRVRRLAEGLSRGGMPFDTIADQIHRAIEGSGEG